MFKKYSLFLILSVFLINIANFVSAEIIPIKKPSQTIEEKEQKLLITLEKSLPIEKSRSQQNLTIINQSIYSHLTIDIP